MVHHISSFCKLKFSVGILILCVKYYHTSIIDYNNVTSNKEIIKRKLKNKKLIKKKRLNFNGCKIKRIKKFKISFTLCFQSPALLIICTVLVCGRQSLLYINHDLPPWQHIYLTILLMCAIKDSHWFLLKMYLGWGIMYVLCFDGFSF